MTDPLDLNRTKYLREPLEKMSDYARCQYKCEKTCNDSLV
jgi:hypothetical protein